MKRVKLKDGKVLRFPASTSDEVIKRTVASIKGAKEMPETKEAKEEPKKDMADLITKMSEIGEGKSKAATKTAMLVVDSLGADIRALSAAVLQSGDMVAKSQKENTAAIKSLVSATKSKREIIRDEDGNIKGIK